MYYSIVVVYIHAYACNGCFTGDYCENNRIYANGWFLAYTTLTKLFSKLNRVNYIIKLESPGGREDEKSGRGGWGGDALFLISCINGNRRELHPALTGCANTCSTAF